MCYKLTCIVLFYWPLNCVWFYYLLYMYMYALICRGCLLKWFSIMLIIIAFTIVLQLAVKTTQFISGTHFMDTIAVLMSHIIIWWVVHCVTCTYTDNESTHGVSNKLICTCVHPSIQPMGICSRACIYTFSLFGVQLFIYQQCTVIFLNCGKVLIVLI